MNRTTTITRDDVRCARLAAHYAAAVRQFRADGDDEPHASAEQFFVNYDEEGAEAAFRRDLDRGVRLLSAYAYHETHAFVAGTADAHAAVVPADAFLFAHGHIAHAAAQQWCWLEPR